MSDIRIGIIGAGYIACEFACILNGLGVDVIHLVRGKSLLRGFDHDLSSILDKEIISIPPKQTLDVIRKALEEEKSR